jgi:hypothetical protein
VTPHPLTPGEQAQLRHLTYSDADVGVWARHLEQEHGRDAGADAARDFKMCSHPGHTVCVFWEAVARTIEGDVPEDRVTSAAAQRVRGPKRVAVKVALPCRHARPQPVQRLLAGGHGGALLAQLGDGFGGNRHELRLARREIRADHGVGGIPVDSEFGVHVFRIARSRLWGKP